MERLENAVREKFKSEKGWGPGSCQGAAEYSLDFLKRVELGDPVIQIVTGRICTQSGVVFPLNYQGIPPKGAPRFPDCATTILEGDFKVFKWKDSCIWEFSHIIRDVRVCAPMHTVARCTVGDKDVVVDFSINQFTHLEEHLMFLPLY
mmetsp:Transcript_45598/g.116648  ORF Transcript_45598/g.116648 Transcript_45598/m.116648 type:complete len:148 (-) Transcript_45598:243-686(-)